MVEHFGDLEVLNLGSVILEAGFIPRQKACGSV